MRFFNWKWGILIVLALGIKVFSLFPEAVERYYANGFYPLISRFQRIVLGWIPFSVGDILYAVAVLAFVRWAVLFSKKLLYRRITRSVMLQVFRGGLATALIIYVWFNLSWGLNYNRPSLASRMDLAVEMPAKEELANLMLHLAGRVNTLYPDALARREALHRHAPLFTGAVQAYADLARIDTGYTYTFPAIKASMFSYPGNYLGFTGYYNPFTGEAQVNTRVPEFIRPFTTCHEIGHQLGYAKESEANFAGFLAASASSDAAFRYSAYFDMYSYARGYLYRQDSLLLRQIDAALLPGVRADFRELRNFSLRYANPVEVLIDRWYAQYLRANQQPSGKVSYNEVIPLLMAWYKKNGSV